MAADELDIAPRVPKHALSPLHTRAELLSAREKAASAMFRAETITAAFAHRAHYRAWSPCLGAC